MNPIKVGMISLGCSKNQVDAELMMAMIVEGGWQVVGDSEHCDVVIINTCGFIDDASGNPSIPFWSIAARRRKAASGRWWSPDVWRNGISRSWRRRSPRRMWCWASAKTAISYRPSGKPWKDSGWWSLDPRRTWGWKESGFWPIPPISPTSRWRRAATTGAAIVPFP